MKNKDNLFKKTSIFIVSDLPDLTLLQYCLLSILGNLPEIDKICVLIPKQAFKYFEFFFDKNITFIDRGEYDTANLNSFQNHELIKLTVPHQLIDSEYLWFIDSDYIFYKKLSANDLWIDELPLHFFYRWDEINSFWKSGSQKLLNKTLRFSQMVNPPYLIKTSHLAELNSEINFRDLDFKQGHISEFEVIFNYLYENKFHDYSWVRYSTIKSDYGRSGFLLHQSPPSYFNLNSKFRVFSYLKFKYVVIWSHWHYSEIFAKKLTILGLLFKMKLDLLKYAWCLNRIPIDLVISLNQIVDLDTLGIAHADYCIKKSFDFNVWLDGSKHLILTGANLSKYFLKISSKYDLNIFQSDTQIVIANNSCSNNFIVSFDLIRFNNVEPSGRKHSCRIFKISSY